MIIWDVVVAENRMMERWAELMGCSIQAKDSVTITMAYQTIRFTFSHSSLVQETCPLSCYVLLAGRFIRQVLFVATFQVTCSQHCDITSYQATCLSRCKCGLSFTLSKSFLRSRMIIHRLPTSLIISSHSSHHTQN